MRRLLYSCVAMLMGASIAQAQNLVVTSNGGVWETATRKCFVKPYEDKTGKSVSVILGTPAQWTNQIIANPASPPIDVIISSVDGVLETMRRGIVDPMPFEKVPAQADMDPRHVALGSGHGAVMAFSSLGIAYNASVVKKPPASWKEFVDRTIAGEWKVAIPGMRQGSTPSAVLWMFANAFGGGVDNIEPGFDAIKRMKASGNLRIWNDMNEFLTLIKTGEIDLGMYWEGRTWSFHDTGNPEIQFIRPAPGVVVNNAIIQKVKNGKDLAWDFINIVLSPEGQLCFSSAIQYGTANKKVELQGELSKRLAKVDEIVWPPYDAITPHVRTWVERWNKEIDR